MGIRLGTSGNSGNGNVKTFIAQGNTSHGFIGVGNGSSSEPVNIGEIYNGFRLRYLNSGNFDIAVNKGSTTPSSALTILRTNSNIGIGTDSPKE